MEQEPIRPQPEAPSADPPREPAPAPVAPPPPPPFPPPPPARPLPAAPAVFEGELEPRVDPLPFAPPAPVENEPFVPEAPLGADAPAGPSATGEIWNGVPPTPREDAPVSVEYSRRAVAAEPAPTAGSNMMLAFVCWIAAATALFEVYGLWANHMRSYAFSGYLALGLGVLLFGFEALLAGRSRRRWALLLFTPAALLTLIGVICLVLSSAPGRRI